MQARVTGPMMTEEALRALPDDGCRHELLEGRLLSEPRPAFGHGRIQSRVAHLLLEFVEARRLGAVTTESGFLLARDPDTVRGPDVAFVAANRVPTLGDARRFFPGAPDLAIEIVSPSDATDEIHAKVADYLAAGTRLVWVVDPQAKTIDVYRTLLAPRRLGADATLEGEDVIPGFTMPARAMFEF